MLRRLEKEIIEKKLIDENEKVLIGVSGGPDSIALLYALHRLAPKYRWELFVVHIDHQLRSESDDDADYVEHCCREWGVPCTVAKVNVRERIQAEGGGVQEVARSLRYQVFTEVSEKWGIKKLALGHHADDQVETVLMHLIRGTGTTGLMGMQVKRSWKDKELIRPLLSFTKKEIEAYCELENLHPRLDVSNLSTDYMRNRIRIELLPILNTYNPQFKERILQLSKILKEEEKVWEELVSDAVDKVMGQETSGETSIHIPHLRQLPVALQRRTIKLILNSLMRESGETTLHAIEQIRKLAFQINPSGCSQLPCGYLAEREYDKLLLFKSHRRNAGKSLSGTITSVVDLIPQGVVSLPGMIGKIEQIQSASSLETLPPCRDWAVFDASRIEAPLRVRSRKHGDRMTCHGMEGTKKVKKLFIEEKIPRNLRNYYPMLTSKDDQILWIPGVRRSNHALINENTKQFLYLLWVVNEFNDTK